MGNRLDKYGALKQAAMTITSDLSLDVVLQRLTDLARNLAQARYAALGVAREDRKGLSMFIASGMTKEQIAAIGQWPRGLGLLGLLLSHPRPLRVRNIQRSPHAIGFPVGHPDMTSFLGVPILLRGRILGNFYLTDRLGAQEFSADDQQLVEALASLAAIVIENTRLYTETLVQLRRKAQEVDKVEDQLRFLVELSGLLPTGPILGKPPLEEVLSRAAMLLGDACGVYLANPDGVITTKVMVHRIPARAVAVAQFVDELWDTLRDNVLNKDRTIFVSDANEVSSSVLGQKAEGIRELNISAALALPIKSTGRTYGVFLSLASQPLELTREDLSFGQLIAARLGTAIENSALVTAMGETLSQRDESIAALTQAEKSLSQFAAIVEGSDDAIIGNTPDGVITNWNAGAERLYGYYAAEAIGQPIAMIVPADRRDEVAMITERMKRGERVMHFDTVRVRKDGSLVAVSLSISPLKDKADRIIGSSAIARDISERKEVERFREQYLSLVSHDLRTPLTTLIGVADWLRRALQERGMEREANSAESMLRNAQRMNAMIQELVESVRLESGQLKLHTEPTDLFHMLSELADRVGALEDRQRIKVEMRQPVPPVLVDQARIERAIVNVITNALKYSPKDKPVLVRIEPYESAALVSVSDKGMGIPQEDIPHLFERHFRAKAASQMEGLGLGLYIARLIVEAHGGRIWVESEVGRGSTFYLRLPPV